MPPTRERGPDEVGSREAARRARLALEHALFSLRELPEHAGRVDRVAERDRLLRALLLLYVVSDGEPWELSHQEALDEAATRAGEAAEAWAGLASAEPRSSAEDAELARRVHGALVGARDELRQAGERVAALRASRRDRYDGGRPGEPVPPPEPFRVCQGAPRWFALQRMQLTPFVDVGALEPAGEAAPSAPPKALAPPRSEQALRALGASFAAVEAAEAAPAPQAVGARSRSAPPPADWAYEPASHELELVRSLARESLEELGLARHLRLPNANETWLDQEPFESRLLTHLDAFFSLGPVALPLAPLSVAEADPPDPDRAFALSLVLGSLAGADAALTLALSLGQSAPELLPGFREGLALAPGAEGGAPIDVALRDLVLAHGSAERWGRRRPELVALALSVLDARGTLTDDAATAALSHEEPEVLAALADVLAHTLPRELAIDLLETRLLAREPAIARRALASLVRRRAPFVAARLRALAAEQGPLSAEATRLLALTGSADDHELVARWLVRAPSPALARAAGRMGHVGLLGPLSALLLHDDELLVEAAAESLERMMGAGLFETVELAWDIPLPDEARERGAPLPTRPVRRVLRAPEAWRGAVARFSRTREGARDPSVKWRGGQPFHPVVLVDELAAASTPPARRVEAHEELTLLVGRLPAFRTDDWVARQREALARARPELERLGPAGAWSFRLLTPSSPPPRRSSMPPRPASEPPHRPSPSPPSSPSPRPSPLPHQARPPAPVEPPPPRAPAVPSFLLHRTDASLSSTLSPFDPSEIEPGAPLADPARPVLPFQPSAPRPVGPSGLPFGGSPPIQTPAPVIVVKREEPPSLGATMLGATSDKPALPFGGSPRASGQPTDPLGRTLADTSTSVALPFEISLTWEELAEVVVDFERRGGAPGPRSLELGVHDKAELERARMRFLQPFLQAPDSYKRFVARCEELRKKP